MSLKLICWFNLLFLLLIAGTPVFAQQDSLPEKGKPNLDISGVVDFFYGYDFNLPGENKRLPFLYNHNRHHRPALNLGMVKLGLSKEWFRTNLAVHGGTYSTDNYADEPGVLKHVFEANAGILLSSKGDVWLDTGVMPSHIGFESAISTDNWTLTRSILAENSPYYLTGGKLSFQPTEKWFFSALILNGWQRITRVAGTKKPSFGTQVSYRPKEGMLINWSTFMGSSDPDLTRRARYFSNLYGQFQIGNSFGLILGMDLGVQQQQKGASVYDAWYSPVVIGQLTWNQRMKSAFRLQYYQDRAGVIIPTDNTLSGFSTAGFSANLDYALGEGLVLRVEASNYRSRDQVFSYPESPTATNFFLISSLAYRF